jgi:hypothetical protein
MFLTSPESGTSHPPSTSDVQNSEGRIDYPKAHTASLAHYVNIALEAIPADKTKSGKEPKEAVESRFTAVPNRDTPNLVPTYSGVFEPAHIGHQQLLRTTFGGAKKHLNAKAVIILPTSNAALQYKVEGKNLWDSKLHLLSQSDHATIWGTVQSSPAGPTSSARLVWKKRMFQFIGHSKRS